jgi:hypothetical protein
MDGTTAATKAAIAALTPAAGQGSISAATKTAVAALPGFARWLISGIAHNALNTNKNGGTSRYNKVAGTKHDKRKHRGKSPDFTN